MSSADDKKSMKHRTNLGDFNATENLKNFLWKDSATKEMFMWKEKCIKVYLGVYKTDVSLYLQNNKKFHVDIA